MVTRPRRVSRLENRAALRLVAWASVGFAPVGIVLGLPPFAQAQGIGEVTRVLDSVDELMGAGRHGAALKALDQLIEERPENRKRGFVQLQRARCLLRVGRLSDAKTALHLARRSRELHLESQIKKLQESVRDIEQRISDIERAEDVTDVDGLVLSWTNARDGWLDVKVAEAKVLSRLGAYDKATAAWHHLKTIAGSDMPWLAAEADSELKSVATLILERLKRVANRAEALDRWWKEAEENAILAQSVEAQCFVADLLFDAGRGGEALVRLTNQATDGDWSPLDRARLWDRVGVIAERLERLLEALTAYERAEGWAREGGDAVGASDLENKARSIRDRISRVRVVCRPEDDGRSSWPAETGLQITLVGVEGAWHCGEGWRYVPVGKWMMDVRDSAHTTRSDLPLVGGSEAVVVISPRRSFGNLPWYLIGGAAVALGGAGVTAAWLLDIEERRNERFQNIVAVIEAADDPTEEAIAARKEQEAVEADHADVNKQEAGTILFYCLVGASSTLALSAVTLLLLETEGPRVTVTLNGIGISGEF